MHHAHARINNYRGQKHQLLGTQGPAPAWRTNVATQNAASARRASASGLAQPSEGGSKILLSRLPNDVSEQEVMELFNKTVGPTKDVFLIFNNKAQPKGMAVVTFQKTTDAALAKSKYNGKIVDGKRPIKIEMIVDEIPEAKQGPNPGSQQKPQSLIERMQVAPAAPKAPSSNQTKRALAAAPATAGKPKSQPTKRKARTRKGPARLKKRSVSAEDLDREMEAYRAAVPLGGNIIIFPPKQETMVM